jgi:Mn2+/Fe2+ NRAMP family transporter
METPTKSTKNVQYLLEILSLILIFFIIDLLLGEGIKHTLILSIALIIICIPIYLILSYFRDKQKGILPFSLSYSVKFFVINYELFVSYFTVLPLWIDFVGDTRQSSPCAFSAMSIIPCE